MGPWYLEEEDTRTKTRFGVSASELIADDITGHGDDIERASRRGSNYVGKLLPAVSSLIY